MALLGNGETAEPRGLLVCFGQPGLRDTAGWRPVTGHAGRLMLALVSRRDGVTLDGLHDVVWPDVAPKSSRAALHVHLGRLRKEFAGLTNAPEIVRSGRVYRLEPGSWEIDVDVFDDFRRRAVELGSSDPHAAVELIERALEFSTRPAFTVEGESVAPAETHRLELVRLDLEEMLVANLLDCGRAVDGEARAVEFVDAEPFRERRWVLLMRAQAAQNRTRDALATYRRARSWFVRELGLEPGEELQSMQRLLLFPDDSMRPAAAVSRSSVLDAIPQVIGALVERDTEIDRVERLLAGGTPVTLIGAPGVGKTRLAIELARRARTGGRTVAWIDLRTATALFDEADLREWARRSPGGLAVVDNAETAPELAGRIVEILTMFSDDLGVVVTSRVRLDVEAAVQPIAPLGLPSDDQDIENAPAVRLLRSMLDLQAPNARVESRSAARLVTRVGGLPLGIRLVAEAARSIAPAEIVEALPATIMAEITPAVDWLLSRLPTEVRHAFIVLSVVPGDLDVQMVEALIGSSDALDSASMLCDQGLLHFEDVPTGSTYSMLEPLRDAAAVLLTEPERDAVLGRMVAECVRRAEDMAMPWRQRDSEQVIEVRLARELPWHRMAIDFATRHSDDEPALRIASGVELGLYAVGRWRDATALQELALSIPGSSSALRARVLAARGRPGLLHLLDERYLGAAIDMAREVGDGSAEARALYYSGIREWWHGRHRESFAQFALAAQRAREEKDWYAELEAERFEAVARVTVGEHERGLQTLCAVLGRIEAMHGMDLLLPHVRMYLGHCRRHVGDDDAAFLDLDLARQEYEVLGNTTSLIHVCAGLAEIAADRDDLPAVMRFSGRGLELAAQGGLTVYDPWLYVSTARAAAAAGEVDTARASAAAAVEAMSRSWFGETHRIALELASLARLLGDDETCARLIGVADAWVDKRELPFRSPAEVSRAIESRSVAAAVKAADVDPPPLTLREASFSLTAPA